MKKTPQIKQVEPLTVKKDILKDIQKGSLRKDAINFKGSISPLEQKVSGKYKRPDKYPTTVVPAARRQILYTTVRRQKITFTPDGIHHTEANIVKHSYDLKRSCYMLEFDDELTYLDDGAFMDCSALKTVILPDSVSDIGLHAFERCTNLHRIRLGKNVRYIHTQAFLLCESLSSIELPDGLRVICHEAFECSGLKDIKLPSSLIGVGNYDHPERGIVQGLYYNPFAGCTKLTSFSGKFATADGKFLVFKNYLGESGNDYLIAAAPGAFDINTECFMPDGIKTIGYAAFYGLKVLFVDIPKGVTALEDSSFMYITTNGTAITVAETVSHIGQHAFDGVSIGGLRFEGDTLPAIDNAAFGSHSNINYPIYITAFAAHNSAPALRERSNKWSGYKGRITVWQGDKEIWYHTTDNAPIAFGGNFGNTDNPASAIGASFALDRSLSSAAITRFDVSIPEDEKIFIQPFDAPVTGVPVRAFFQKYSLDYVSLPLTVSSIGDWAFYQCQSLLMFPLEHTAQSLTSIGAYAFADDSLMKFSNSNAILMNNVKELGNYAFLNCEAFGAANPDQPKSILILGQITRFGQGTFKNCKKITHIRIKGGQSGHETDCIGAIGINAFSGCEQLVQIDSFSSTNETINLPNVSEIGLSAFENCSKIKSVTLGAPTSIGERAFYKCESLQSVTLLNPDALTTLCDNAFIMCIKLEKVGGSSVQTGVLLPKVTTVGEWAFANCRNIKSIDLPEATTLVGTVNNSRNFGACFSLETVNLPKVTVIPEYCFVNCKALTAVAIPLVKTIERSAFRFCTALTSLSLPSIETIGILAFEYTRNLTELRLGANLTSIGKSIFYDSDVNVRNTGKLKLYLYTTDAKFWDDAIKYDTLYNYFCYDSSSSSTDPFKFHQIYLPEDPYRDIVETYHLYEDFFDTAVSGSGFYLIDA